MNSQGKVKLQVWLLIVAVFALGGVTGASLDRLYLLKKDPARLWAASGGERGRGGCEHRALDKIRNDLNLTDEQTSKVRAIFEETRKEFPPQRFAECPGFKEMREHTRERIRAVLTPEQQKLYDQINAHRDAEINQQK